MGDLTSAQLKCLRVLAKTDYWINYGTACGVKRNVARALDAKGLAKLDDTCRPGVSAIITTAGRQALKGGDE